jgi:hypothetical protein
MVCIPHIGRIGRFASFGIFVATQLTLGVPQAQAGILDFLFGRPVDPVTVAPAPWSPASNEFRRSPKPVPLASRTATPAVKSSTSISLCCKDGGDPMRALMNDPTLRDGDAVMTDHGMTVFKGSAHERVHQPGDFVAVAKAGNVPPAERLRITALAANSTP